MIGEVSSYKLKIFYVSRFVKNQSKLGTAKSRLSSKFTAEQPSALGQLTSSQMLSQKDVGKLQLQ